VPFLGRIPIIGLAFKTRAADHNKTNLMIFIRPKILRDGVQASYETDAKYQYIMEEQKKTNGGREILPLLPGPKPKLPPAPPAPQTEDALETDPRVQQEIDRKKRLQEERRKQQEQQNQAAPPAESQGAPAPQASPAPTPPADLPPPGAQTPPRQ